MKDKVHCKDCRFVYRPWKNGYISDDQECGCVTFDRQEYTGEHLNEKTVDISENRNGNCKHYKKANFFEKLVK